MYFNTAFLKAYDSPKSHPYDSKHNDNDDCKIMQIKKHPMKGG